MIIKIASQLLLLFFVGLTISHPVLSQELLALKTVIINAEVTSSAESGIFTYTYAVTNPSTNTGQIGLIDIDISKPVGGLELSDEGLVNQGAFDEHSSKAILEQSRSASPVIPAVPMIPVGVTSPQSWVGGLSVAGTVGWGNAGESFRMLPGQSVSGYQITSRGLPGIRVFTVEPHLDYDHLPIEPPNETDEDLERYKKELAALKDSVSAKGKTLGPTAPPAQFVALDFLSYLINLKHQASTLGWITNKGVENSLDVKLDQVKKKLQAGDTKTALNVLKAFINEVNAQGCEKYEGCPTGKHLLPEAWALLKFNAEFLLGKL